MGVLFIELVRLHSSIPQDNVNLYTQERLEAFLSLLEIHANQKQVSEYAAMLNLSAYQLNAITKAALGRTCSELISEHVILEAKDYLLATSKPNKSNSISPGI